jgi:signal transduction histidine kinase
MPDPVSAVVRRAALADPHRLQAVRATGLLDGPPDAALDRWVRMAARALDAPVSLLTLVEADRDFVTAHVGLPEPVAAAREVRAAPSFCQDAVSRQEARRAALLAAGESPGDPGALPPPVVVTDAAADPLYCTFPSVRLMGVRACVTAPILGAGGHALGSLCVLDFAPRAWTPDQVATLHDLAHAAAAEMALRAAGVAAAARGAELAAANVELALANGQLQEQAVELEVANLQMHVQQAELGAANAHLTETADRLAAREGELHAAVAAERAARGAAEEANAAKSQFLRTVSHELRTPLQATIGFSALMAEGVAGPVTPAQQDYLRRIRAGGDHLLVLINDLLGFARLEAGQVAIRPAAVPVAGALDAAAALFVGAAAAKGVAFVRLPVDAGLRAWADADRLTQVLGNLLTNAVKFTDAGGRVELGAASDGGLVRVWVRDTGRGIAPDEVERVFDPFVQVDRELTAAPQQGVGLGLAIARDLARRMGGDVAVTSVPGAGSEFTVRVPAAG